MAIISGVLRNASGVRANTTIMLIATQTTSKVIIKAQDTSVVTDAKGAYSFECNPSCYLVVVREQGATREQVGSICVYADSKDGTLEQYLTDWNPDALEPEIIKRLEALEASATLAATNAKISETNAAKSALEAKETISEVGAVGDEQVAKVTAEGGKQVKRVTDTGNSKVSAVNAAGNTQVKAVGDKGTEQVALVVAAKTDAVNTINPLVATATAKANEASQSATNAQTDADRAEHNATLTDADKDAVTAMQTDVTSKHNDVIAKTAEVESNAATVASNMAATIAKAGESATNAQSAKVSADKATTQQVEATKQAVLSKASADKAKQVTGLDTVAEAVQTALADSYQYAMTKADFDANREMNKAQYAGSGFVEFRKERDLNNKYGTKIAHGLWAYTFTPSVLYTGRDSGSEGTGISSSSEAITCVDGVRQEIMTGSGKQALILLPPACDGTKSYDSATGIVTDHLTYLDPKYGNTPAADHNEAVSRCFEGLVKNGDFRLGAEGWWLAPSSTVTGNTLHLKTITSEAASSGLNYTLDLGTRYKLTVNIEVISGSARIDLDSVNGLGDGLGNVTGGNVTAGVNQEFVYEFVPDIANPLMQFFCFSNSEIVISNISIHPVTSAPILTRQDLGFVESWQEDTSEKGVLLPLGNTQYGATSWDGIPLKKLTDLGVGQGYSAFGEWDKKTVGYGALISELTDVQLKQFLQDPRNNIYFDAETNKLIQARYRVRVVEGLNDSPYNVEPANNTYIDAVTWKGVNGRIRRQGSSEVSTDFDTKSYFFSATHTYNHATFGDMAVWQRDNVIGMPIFLRQTYNQGAGDKTYNPFGMATFSDGKPWYSSSIKPTSAKDCFINAANGSIASGKSGSILSGFEYYDAVYASQIKDLRLSAQKQDVNKLRVDAERKAVAGEMRGWGKVPFTNNDMTVKMLSPQCDILGFTDIFGSDADIKTAFANGVTGIVNNKANGELMEKAESNTANVVIGDGKTWTSSNVNINPTTNRVNISVPSGKVALIQYPALSNFTEAANNSVVVGEMGDVTVTTRHEVDQGNRLHGSLLGNIGKDTNNGLTDVSKTKQTTATIEHVPHGFTVPANESTGCKVAHSIIEKYGLLYSQYQAIEIKNNGTDWGDTSNAIPVVNGDGTHTDDNGQTVKVANHIGMIPLGIASYSDSSQAK